jgi:hypothetical protein
MMKKIFFGFTLILVNLLNAQTAERVYSIAKEQRPIEWYQEQEVLCLKILKKDKKNATAWILGGREVSGEQNLRSKLDSLAETCYKTIPNEPQISTNRDANALENRGINMKSVPTSILIRSYQLLDEN